MELQSSHKRISYSTFRIWPTVVRPLNTIQSFLIFFEHGFFPFCFLFPDSGRGLMNEETVRNNECFCSHNIVTSLTAYIQFVYYDTAQSSVDTRWRSRLHLSWTSANAIWSSQIWAVYVVSLLRVYEYTKPTFCQHLTRLSLLGTLAYCM